MRKQYHFRSSKQGLDAWDVDRLIELSKAMEPKLICLDSIMELDENYWFGGEGDNPTCRAIAEHAKLIQMTDMTHPIILCSAGRVMDGMHRACRAYIEGEDKIMAVQFVIDPEPDFEDVQSPDDLPY
ncbi:MAG: hypothetical protein B6D72_01730 [gamma proteobacterium symbiont of Ctena orbiculata]|uniref:Uncharacterized protein n=1 Tax=Candidatus Thiodiazotropha taylori TaxID=2792791 RepID=A0A944QTX2_9GAMM|nr:hypothetical protein [Candidatus Thiodiazotropha taylori]PUB82843.1 MAG: hypothetical protein DBP00_16970 [gamma proteobacterium symbiont of Ctena orbiculata]MBT2990408.1 hypothetical protein [Candidatus Thiodiazotropha taylori]MBT2998062.1 hypothetical protein [Candidatus Thiodiazotropha taylori]MBT3002273.1 hypothetical protein [Candidatus Thiodiazotropha taylori]